MNPTGAVLEVIIFGARGLMGSLMVTAPQISVGRDPRSMVHLDDPTVSLRHAVLGFDGHKVRVRDLGSRTGTWLNGVAVSEEAVLSATDELIVGGFRLRLTIHLPEGAADARRRSREVSVPTPFEEIVPTAPPPTRTGGVAPLRGTARPRGTAPAAAKAPTAAKASARPEPDSLNPSTLVDIRPQPVPLPDPTGGVRLPVRLRRRDPDGVESGSPSLPPVTSAPPSPLSDVDALLADALAHGGGSIESGASAPLPLPAFAPVKSPGTPGTWSAEGTSQRRRLDQPGSPPAARQTGSPLAREVAPSVTGVVDSTSGRAVGLELEGPRREEDDDDDDDGDFVSPFDMIEALSLGAKQAMVPGSGALAVEVVHFREDRVLALQHVGQGSSLRVARANADLEVRERNGSFEVVFVASEGIAIQQDDGELPPDAQASVAPGGTLPLLPGVRLRIGLGDDEGLLVHLVSREAALANPRPSFRTQLPRLAMGALSVAAHVLLVVVIGLTILGGKSADADDVNAGRFAKIELKDIEVEPPPPPPVEDPPMPLEARAPRTPHERRSPHQPTASSAPAAHAERERESAQSASALKILKALGTPATGPEPIALASVDAMPRARSGFKVSDVVGKAPGDTLRGTSLGADAQVNTKSASEIGADVGRVHARTGDVVRARVTAAPQAIGGEGHLDRGEIQRVVNAHLFQVQGCYERQLMRDPSLGGKATLQWVISPSGSTSGVRVAQSSVRNVEVLTCIQAAIQHWTFRAPEGGSVTVTYPFAFTSGS